jgi:hypothetical protein
MVGKRLGFARRQNEPAREVQDWAFSRFERYSSASIRLTMIESVAEKVLGLFRYRVTNRSLLSLARSLKGVQADPATARLTRQKLSLDLELPSETHPQLRDLTTEFAVP